MQADASVFKLDINQIIPNKYQPRKVFDEKSLNSLSESIKNYGIINPILVRKKDDKYEIIAGERRFRAAKKIGLTEVPVIIKNADEQEMAELALIENLERQGLSPIEEAKSYEEIIRIGNQTQASLASKLGKSQSAIANKIRLLALPIEIQEALSNKQISERHARSLITLDNKEKQLEMLQRIITEKLTVKETENIIKEKEFNEDEIKQAINDIMKSLNIMEVEDKKEEKEDDNMNNGNFFPNFDNNNIANNNASLNMMNMQSINQAPMEAAPEMVMPTMGVPGPAPMAPTMDMPQQTPELPGMNVNPIPSFDQFGPSSMAPAMDTPQPTPELPGMNVNPIPSFDQFGPSSMAPTMDMPQPTPELPGMNVNPIPSFDQFGPSSMAPTMGIPQPMEDPMAPQPMPSQEAPAMAQPVMEVPLFNPEAMMAPQMNDMPQATGPMSVPGPEQNMLSPTGFEVPLVAPQPMEAPMGPDNQPELNMSSEDKLSELQNLLSSNGYTYKIYNNETENCVIIELPRN